jgi:hypothetical protein
MTNNIRLEPAINAGLSPRDKKGRFCKKGDEKKKIKKIKCPKDIISFYVKEN